MFIRIKLKNGLNDFKVFCHYQTTLSRSDIGDFGKVKIHLSHANVLYYTITTIKPNTQHFYIFHTEKIKLYNRFPSFQAEHKQHGIKINSYLNEPLHKQFQIHRCLSLRHRVQSPQLLSVCSHEKSDKCIVMFDHTCYSCKATIQPFMPNPNKVCK